MTRADFIEFYPQFAAIPEAVCNEYIRQAELRFGDFEDMTDEARRLYVAHKLTLYAQTYAEIPTASSAAAMKKLAGSGVAAQELSKTVGGVSVSKSEGSALQGISGFAEWKQTEFGLQLIGLARIYSFGGRWVP